MPVLSSTMVALTFTDDNFYLLIHFKHKIHYNADKFKVNKKADFSAPKHNIHSFMHYILEFDIIKIKGAQWRSE